MRDRIYLSLFNLFRWVVIHTPKKIKSPLIKALARLIYLLDGKHRRIARVNLDLAFGDMMSDEEKEKIIEKTYENLLFNLADFVQNQGIDKKRLLEKVEFVNEEIVKDALNSGRPVVFITAHYGNWELLPLATAAKFGPLTGVGRPLDSKVMGAMRELMKALKQGRSVGLLVDQNTAENEGLLVSFFGKEARHTPAAALLAMRMNAVIIPAFITTEDHSRYKIEYYPPLEFAGEGEKEERILKNVQAQADITEEAIRKKPDEWFWLHKRWKNRYEHLYKRREDDDR